MIGYRFSTLPFCYAPPISRFMGSSRLIARLQRWSTHAEGMGALAPMNLLKK
jgi:hypothetical protein